MDDDIDILAKALNPNSSAHDEALTAEHRRRRRRLRNQIPPLKTITLKSRPLTSHALTFSCDAELAVAADDSVHVFLPEFPPPEEPATKTTTKTASAANDAEASAAATADGGAAEGKGGQGGGDKTSRQQYYTYILRIPTSRKPDPRMNAALFAAQGLNVPSSSSYDNDWNASSAAATAGGGEDPSATAFEGVGSGTVTGYGASLNQVVAIEWSPGGVGRNLRPVLAVMLTNGALLVLGEGTGPSSGGEIDFGARMRSFRDWRILWGVGANLPLPDADAEDRAHLPRDKIRSFAWARRVDAGRSLLAYATDQEEVVVLSVQYYLPHEQDDSSDAGAYIWEVEEVVRFDGRGPHPSPNVMDPDYVPYTSAFSLKWSPWLVAGDTRTAALAYCARNYVGFRRITIPAKWRRGAGVEVGIEEADVTGICTHLVSDAFVEWEDAVWDCGGARFCRGVIASPFRAMPFQVALDGPEAEAVEAHDVSICGTTYPRDSSSLDATNPISSLLIHVPDMTKYTKSPSYSLVRLSATATNDNWFQQNTAAPAVVVDNNPSSSSATAPRPNNETQDPPSLPKWAETISSVIKLSVPVAMLGRGGGGRRLGPAVADDESDDDDDEDEDDEDDDDDDFDLPEDAGEQIHPYRMRVWGLTASPAGGVTAVLVSQHSTQRPEKSVRTRVMFGGRLSSPSSTPVVTVDAVDRDRDDNDEMDVDGDGVDDDAEATRTPFWEAQSTEAKMWDWMYGGGPPVPETPGSEGIIAAAAAALAAATDDSSLRRRFLGVRERQRCVFCQTSLRDLQGRESICERGHVFATCAATGLAILAPGISRACAVCGRRCLVASEVAKIAREHLGPEATTVEASEEACGGCGGKFVV